MTRIVIPDDAAKNWRYVMMGLGNVRIPPMTLSRFMILCVTSAVVGSFLLLLAQPIAAALSFSGDVILFLVGVGTTLGAAGMTAVYLEPLLVGDRPARYWLTRVLPDLATSYLNALRRDEPISYEITVRPGLFVEKKK